MDKNQVIGIILLVGMFVGWTLWNNSKDNPQLAEQMGDTVETVVPQSTQEEEKVSKETILLDSNAVVIEKEDITITTKELEVVLSNEGGKIKKVSLLNWTDHLGEKVVLMNEESANYRLFGDTKKAGKADLLSKMYTTEAKSKLVSGEESFDVSYAYTSESGTVIEQVYSFKAEGYTFGYQLSIDGVSKEFASSDFEWNWKGVMRRLEKSTENSEQMCTVNYYDVNGDFDDVGAGNESESIETDLKWFSLKQRFFNIGLISEDKFTKAKFQTELLKDDPTAIKDVEATVTIPVSGEVYKGEFTYFFGPNDMDIVKEVTEGYDKNVYLGWPIFSFINKWVVIPIFNFLEGFTHNYGLIILILVIIIKLLLFPIAYKSYVSMAKMKVLKPELDLIKEKLGGDQQKFQLESMALYRQVGVNPLSGCIPVVLQMPILLALFRFFPSAIHLRHESFLWATDLSTYDDVISWGFNLWPLGDHLSIFTVLMTVSQIVYTYYNNQINVQANNQMKYIGYIMPVMFLFILNNFSSGLTYYYFISNLITIAQQLLATRFIDKDKLKIAMEENRKKKATTEKSGKKSGFQQRLEEAMKAQQEKRKK